MRYRIGYSIVPGQHIPDKCFTFSEIPLLSSPNSFTCALYDADRVALQTLQATTGTVVSTPVQIAGLPGTILYVHLNHSGSNEPDIIVPLELYGKGGLAALNRKNIAFTWYE